MIITEVRIKLVENKEKLRAFADVTLGDAFVIHDIRVVEANDKFIVSMPSKKRLINGEDVYTDVCHPITNEFREYINEEVKDAYERELNASQD